MYAKSLREKMPRLSDEMNAIVAKAKAENDRGLTSAEREAFHKLEADYTALEDSIKIAEKASTIVDELAKTPGAKVSDLQAEELQDTFRVRGNRKPTIHDKAFSKFVRHGISALEADERKLMRFEPIKNTTNTGQTLTTTAGGYLIPQGFSDQLEQAKKWFGGIAGVVGKFVTETGNPMPWPTMNDTTHKGRILGINTGVTETDMAFDQVTFNAYIGSSDLILIPLALIEDSYFDLDALVAQVLGTRLGRLYNYECTVSNGSSRPTGIVYAVSQSGNIVTAGVDISPNTETASIAYDDLVNLQHAVDPAYRNNPSTRFMFSDAFLKLLKKLTDGQNRPLWQPGITSSFREGAGVDSMKPMILDTEYIVNSDIAAPATSVYSALYGDMSTFKVREVAGGTTVMRLTERYAEYLQVGYTAFQRFDSNYVDGGTHPIAVLQQA